MNVTREQKLLILNQAINYFQKCSTIGMCLALVMAFDTILGDELFIGEIKKVFPKFTRINYFLNNPRWSIIEAFIMDSVYWDTLDWSNDKDGTIKAAKRRVKFLEYLKTTI